MLRKLLILGGLAAGASTSVPALYQANPQLFARLLQPAVERAAAPQVAEPPAPAAAPLQPPGRKALVEADGRGHFVAAFRINGSPVEAMIDTGATVVALNLSTARRAGITLQPSDFTHTVETANGRVKAAAVEIGSLRIGRIALDDVQAVVLEDRALRTNLVGMSFLGRLGSYRVEDGALLLAQ